MPSARLIPSLQSQKRMCRILNPLLPRSEGFLPECKEPSTAPSTPNCKRERTGVPHNTDAPLLTRMIWKQPLPHLAESRACANLNPTTGKQGENHPQRNTSLWETLGKRCHRVSPPGLLLLGLTIQFLTLRTPCSQPAWSLFCYKREVNRFYSSYKSVTKATVLISIINIHNSSNPARQANWAALQKN